MARPAFELAGVFRQYGGTYRSQHRLPRQQLRVLRAIEVCRTAALGGHVESCGHCDYTRISYNSCRNRHCPKCQNAERARWLEARRQDLLPVEYFHVVFTLPAAVARIALGNQETVYGMLFRAVAETLSTIARDPKHLGAEIGFFAILHTWGQNLEHHPHLHCVVPGGGLTPDLAWVRCKPGFFLPVRVLSRWFRRLFLAALDEAFQAGRLQFPGTLQLFGAPAAWAALLEALRQTEWVVYAKPPFGGPQQVLEYLGRYTHRVAISNQRLLNVTDGKVTFQWKDYRHKDKQKSRVMTLDASEFIRRFLLHTVPPRFQRIRHCGLLANRHRRQKLELCRQLLNNPVTELLPPRQDCPQLSTWLAAKPVVRCPQCGIGTLIRTRILPAYLWPAPPPPDTS